MRIIKTLIVSTSAIMATAYLVPGIRVANFNAAFVAAIVLGLINAIIRPIMLLLTLPINILTLGLFTLVINATMLMLAANIVSGFSVVGFLPALFGSLIISLITSILNSVFKD